MTAANILEKIAQGKNLEFNEMQTFMQQLMTGQLDDSVIGAFLMGLRIKGEDVTEIAAAATVMRELSHKISVESSQHLIDTCGTGGDGARIFNVSTACAFVLAAAGATVAKHGNRSNSSNSGSADVLEALGVNLTQPLEHIQKSITKLNIGFMFAPAHHSAMKHAIGARKAMGIRTLFNLLGPITNPANAPHQLIGVFDNHWLRSLAEVLQKLGSQHVLLVHAHDGLDEITLTGPTQVVELKDNIITEYTISPEAFGLPCLSLDSLIVDSPEASANLIKQAFNNNHKAAQDIIALNAGAGLYAADITDSLEAGVAKAIETIEQGLALQKLEQFISFNQ